MATAWEYFGWSFSNARTQVEQAQEFSRFGAEGWELAATYPDDDSGVMRAMFKRPAGEGSALDGLAAERDALRAAEARAMAAEASVAQLRADLERADGERYARDLERDTMEAQRDAAVTAHASLAAAVREERAARDLVFGGLADGVDFAAGCEAAIAAAPAHAAAVERLDALLRGAPAGVVPVAVVRAYLDAVDAAKAARIDEGTQRYAEWREKLHVAEDARDEARTALAAALAAATTTPEEGHGP